MLDRVDVIGVFSVLITMFDPILRYAINAINLGD
jgi:hypothetical protein